MIINGIQDIDKDLLSFYVGITHNSTFFIATKSVMRQSFNLLVYLALTSSSVPHSN